ncbi:carboxylesterase 5A isoform X2 [Rhinopithecus roxellana]|uniref:carboxylesterase 5A isoform X2 n=1 Tax=Rhinopithecus roxellana TaxID=61622 RepID=UPI0012375D26|nr:carboxylesterase 5A isoform X2 [Rhinopithecus roxellana]
MSGNWVHPGQILFWAIWVLAAPTKGPSAEGPQRNTRLGWIQGKQVTVLGSPVPVNVFLGVPFAAPPLGPLRFTNPQPASPWDNLREATSYPNLCLQNSEWLRLDQHMLKVHYPNIGVSEDCLYLNIYVPAHADVGSKLPVLVWFPGGAFKTGSASIFDGSALAAYEDLLVVVIQYRLGIFGFFTTWDQHAPGNWAFKDQVAALSWVQKNIEFFGGDPSSVTIFGESAGAISVSSLILSPMAKGLFHKAIMESGVAIIPYLKAHDYEKSEDLQVVAHFCGHNASDSEDLLRCLRTKSSKELLTLSQKAKSFTRVVDGAFFPNEPLDLLSQKAFKAIPSIIGVNNHECGFLLPMKEAPEILSGSNKSLALHLIQNILHIPPQYLHLVANEYFHDKHSLTEIRDSLLDLLGDVFFVVPALITARYHRDAGAPVYFYEFRHRPQCFEDTKPAFVKADHADEVRFVFGGAFLKGDIVMFEGATEEEKLLSRKMMKYWATFARTGNPNGDDLPLWPAYNLTEQYLQLDLNMSLGQRLKEPRVEFWTSTIPRSCLLPTCSSPLSFLIFLSLLQPFFFSFVPWEAIFL